MWGATTRWTGNSCELRVGMAPTDLNPIKPIQPLYIYIYAHKYCENQHKSISTHTMEKIQVIWSHVTLGSRKYSILSVFIFLSLVKAQSITLNNWKTMKKNEKKWTPMKKIWKYNKNDETYGKKSTQWKASIYIDIIWSNVTPGSRKYSILSVFVFLSLIKAQRITLDNWKAMKNNEK